MNTLKLDLNGVIYPSYYSERAEREYVFISEYGHEYQVLVNEDNVDVPALCYMPVIATGIIVKDYHEDIFFINDLILLENSTIFNQRVS